MNRLVVLAALGSVAFPSPVAAQEPAARAAPAALPAEVSGARPQPIPGGFGYPVLDVDRRHILDLLQQGRFDELDRFFEALDSLTDDDIRREDELVVAYDAFFGPDPRIGTRINEWVAYSSSRSEAPLIARAQFHRARAWEARGESRLTDADSLRVRQMNAHLTSGLRDLARASQIDQHNLATYSMVLALLYPWGWSDDAEEVLDAGLSSFPTSHWLRYRALAAMTPRWGGSYEAMQRRVDEAQEYAEENPRLRALRGAVALDRANELSLERRHAEAVVAVEEARTEEVDWSFYYRRGHILFMAREYARALADLNEAVARRPLSSQVLEDRGRVLVRITQHLVPPERRAEFLGYAEADLREAVALGQADSTLASWATYAGVAKAECERAPRTCVPQSGTSGAPEIFEPETWTGRMALFLVSLPLTLIMVLLEGDRLYLLPAPALAGISFVWNFSAWRKQRYWTPRIIHVMSAVGLLLLLWINLNWILFGGGMWTQRFVVIAVSALVPYAVYLIMGGPRYMAKKGRVPTRTDPRG